MAKTTPERIVLRSGNVNGVVRREALAKADLTPGELLGFSTAGDLQAHATERGVLDGRIICLENLTPDDGANPSISVDYDDGDTVYYAVGIPGDEFYMWLEAGETVVANTTMLVSDGAGALQAETVDATTLAQSIVGQAVDSTTAGTVRVRLHVRIT